VNMAIPLNSSMAMLDGLIAGLETTLGVSPQIVSKGQKEEKTKKEVDKTAKPEGKVEGKKEGGKKEGGDDKKGGEKKEKKEKTAAAPAAAPAADQPEFTKLELKVGVLTKTWHHPDSEKLFCEEIDVGEELPRQIASGLRAHFTLENFCPGRKVIVVTNLKAAKMAGFESQGMVMASIHAEGKVELLDPPADALVGERVFCDGVTGEPMQPNQVQKKKILPEVLKDLRTDAACVATWQGKPMMTSKGAIKVASNANSVIS